MADGRTRVLVVTKWVPDGPPSGGVIRTHALIDALRTRFDVRIIGYRENGSPSPRRKVEALVHGLLTRQAYQVSRYDRPGLRAAIAREVAEFRPAAIHVDYIQLAPFVRDVPLPRLVDMHNVESVFAQGVAETTRWPISMIAARDARKLRALEEEVARDYELVIVNSATEAARTPGAPEVVPNGVFPSKAPLDVTPDPRRVVFVGLFSWIPNIEGAEWLVNEVLPLLPDDVTVDLVGRRPDRRVEELAGPRVRVTGEVPDTWPYVAASTVVLCPILSTGGTRHKILEGLLAERPVVSTPEGADGLHDLEGEGLVLASGPQAFADAVTALLDDGTQAERLGRAGRRAVVDRYDWARIGERLLGLYDTRLGVR